MKIPGKYTIDHYISDLEKALSCDDGHNEALGAYPFIPLPFSIFCAHLSQAKEVFQDSHGTIPIIKFLDIGCGPGTKILLAREMGFDSWGLEINEQHKTSAEKLYIGGRIIWQDGRKFSGYNNFDILYFYRPMFDSKLQAKLQKQIYGTMRVGAVIIAELKQPCSRKEPLSVIGVKTTKGIKWIQEETQ